MTPTTRRRQSDQFSIPARNRVLCQGATLCRTLARGIWGYDAQMVCAPARLVFLSALLIGGRLLARIPAFDFYPEFRTWWFALPDGQRSPMEETAACARSVGASLGVLGLADLAIGQESGAHDTWPPSPPPSGLSVCTAGGAQNAAKRRKLV